MKVSACLVTRGDVDMDPILWAIKESGIEDVVVVDNSKQESNYAVLGRYLAIREAKHPLIYVQDDDCFVSPEVIRELVERHEPGKITANMSLEEGNALYFDSGLLGCGAVFERDLPRQAFDRYMDVFPNEDPDFFYRRCDNIFSVLTPMQRVALGFRWMAWFDAPNRMYKHPDHSRERDHALEKARIVRDLA